ncbi:MAG: hypothetical protein MUF42_10220 [Cytophagaceae bacterium]|jgi:hypothetical protein|nr:hypothetical protein [Cytophagaceae bacterium]
MKKILIAIAVMFQFSVWAQSPKLIAVINHADWCPSCKAHGDRIYKEFINQIDTASIRLIINDVTSEASKEKSKPLLEDAGVAETMKSEKSSGMIFLIDSTTKKVIKSIGVNKSTEEINKSVAEALKKK